MGEEVHVAVPGKIGPETATHRKAAEPHIGHRDRLHDEIILAVGLAVDDRELRHAHQRALEGQHPVAVARSAFGKQDQFVAIGDAGMDFIALFSRAGAALTLDENCLL